MRNGSTVAHPCNMTAFNISPWTDKYKNKAQYFDDFRKKNGDDNYVSRDDHSLQGAKSEG